MGRFLVRGIVLGLVTIIGSAQSNAPQGESPTQVVEQFWKMNAGGAWSSPESWAKLQELVGTTAPWSPAKSIDVLRGYHIGDARKQAHKGVAYYQVEVDFSEWGEVDPFLNFIRARGTGEKNSGRSVPVERRIYESLYLSDMYVSSSLSGQEKEEKGLFRWRVSVPVYRRADVDTAIRWVTEMGGNSTDPAIKYNAGRTLAILKSLSAGAPLAGQARATAQESPSEIGKRFIDLERNSTPDQWSELAKFFVETPRPQWNRVHIVDIVDTGVDTNGDSSFFVLRTNALGDLDSSLRLSGYPSMRLPLDTPSASACLGDDRFGFTLLLSDKQWEISRDGAAKELDGPVAWRIEDTSFQPLITLDTAIRYVTNARENSKDPVVRKNADRTLAILSRFKEGKPLPKELLSGLSGGCS